MLISSDDNVDLDLTRIISRAFREAEEQGVGYDDATGAAIRAILAVYPDWSHDHALSHFHRLESSAY